MAQLKYPIFAKASTYSALTDAIQSGKFDQIDRVVYCYVIDSGLLYRIELDKEIYPIYGANKKQILVLDELPDVSQGDQEVFYIVDDVTYLFNGTSYKPVYQPLVSMIEDVTSDVNSVREDIVTLSEYFSDLTTVVNSKADASSVYTKSETDNLLNTKPDADTVYTKDETDVLLSSKADSNSVYNKDEVDQKLSVKLEASDVYSKQEVDDMLGSMVVEEGGQPVTVQQYVNTAINETKDYIDEQIQLNIV